MAQLSRSGTVATEVQLFDAEFTEAIEAIDDVLGDIELIQRLRRLDRAMVMQVFYVRKFIVGNSALPRKLRINALSQLLATMGNLPDFMISGHPHHERYGRKAIRVGGGLPVFPVCPSPLGKRESRDAN